MSWNSKMLVQIHELQVQIHEIRVQIYELRVQIYEFTSVNLRVTSSSKTQVNSLTY